MIMMDEVLKEFLYICGAIITISQVVGVWMKYQQWKQKPNRLQDEKIAEHEIILKNHEEKFKEYLTFFQKDKERLDKIEQSNKVTQKALLALLSHALNGNDTDSLRSAKDDLEDYLTSVK